MPLGPPIELRLERALPIEINDDFQPSGLAFRGERLLTVSDKHDSAVHEIILGETSATLRTFVAFAPPAEGSEPLDFEGIAADADGALLLASEARYRALRVDLGGGATWLTPSLEGIGHAAGLFRKYNANLEGIARLADGRLLLAAEREPRGLIELPANGDLSSARVWAMPESIYAVPSGRDTDFSDLAVDGRRTYVLERNSHLVVRIERIAERWEEREAWSYATTENDPRFAYRGSPYGVVEGLAIDRDHVYLVTDNNRLPRAADPNDRRPQLFVFAKPAKW
jgi:uncharacterized protein YjiK